MGNDIYRNADNQFQMPSAVAGYVDEVNGEGAKEIPGFIPTQNELIQLTKYWARELLEIQFFYVVHATSGSTEWRVSEFANLRISRIAELIGKETVDAVIKEAHDDFGKNQDPRLWKIFINHDDAEIMALQEEVARHGSRCSLPCRKENNVEHHETDWAWIEQETQRHRNGDCSIKG